MRNKYYLTQQTSTCVLYMTDSVQSKAVPNTPFVFMFSRTMPLVEIFVFTEKSEQFKYKHGICSHRSHIHNENEQNLFYSAIKRHRPTSFWCCRWQCWNSKIIDSFFCLCQQISVVQSAFVFGHWEKQNAFEKQKYAKWCKKCNHIISETAPIARAVFKGEGLASSPPRKCWEFLKLMWQFCVQQFIWGEKGRWKGKEEREKGENQTPEQNFWLRPCLLDPCKNKLYTHSKLHCATWQLVKWQKSLFGTALVETGEFAGDICPLLDPHALRVSKITVNEVLSATFAHQNTSRQQPQQLQHINNLQSNVWLQELAKKNLTLHKSLTIKFSITRVLRNHSGSAVDDYIHEAMMRQPIGILRSNVLLLWQFDHVRSPVIHCHSTLILWSQYGKHSRSTRATADRVQTKYSSSVSCKVGEEFWTFQNSSATYSNYSVTSATNHDHTVTVLGLYCDLPRFGLKSDRSTVAASVWLGY